MTASAALLRVEALDLPAPASPSPAPPLLNVSFQVAAAEHVAIVGPPAAGKSALLRAAALLAPAAAGRVWFGQAELTRLKPAELRGYRRRLPFIGGDPARAFPPKVTVAQALLEPLEIHRLGTPAERQARLTETVAGLGLNPSLLTRTLPALSVSLRQRVALARGLVLGPELLITDGICDVLEPAAAGPLLERLAAWNRAHGLAWLWSTREPALAARFADRVLRLEAGRLLPA